MTNEQMDTVVANITKHGTASEVALAKLMVAELRSLKAIVLAACCRVRPIRVG